MLIVIGCLALCAMVVETSFPASSFIPDFFAAILVCVIARFRGPTAIALAAVVGVCADAVSSMQFGMQMFWAIAVVTLLSPSQRPANGSRAHRSTSTSASAREFALLTVIVVVLWRGASAASDAVFAGTLQFDVIAINAGLAALTTMVLVVVVGSLFASSPNFPRRVEL